MYEYLNKLKPFLDQEAFAAIEAEMIERFQALKGKIEDVLSRDIKFPALPPMPEFSEENAGKADVSAAAGTESEKAGTESAAIQNFIQNLTRIDADGKEKGKAAEAPDVSVNTVLSEKVREEKTFEKTLEREKELRETLSFSSSVFSEPAAPGIFSEGTKDVQVSDVSESRNAPDILPILERVASDVAAHTGMLEEILDTASKPASSARTGFLRGV